MRFVEAKGNMIRHRRKQLPSYATAFVLIMSVHAGAQNTQELERYLQYGNNCESNIIRLQNIDNAAGKDGLVIAVARLGDGERTRDLNRRRLHNIRLYLKEIRQRPAETLVMAEGESVRGRGRVEVYVGGKLVDVFILKRGEDLAAGSCDGTGDIDHLYHGVRRRKSR